MINETDKAAALNTLALQFARHYCDFLATDNGVVSRSHLLMIEHCKMLSDEAQTIYHDRIAEILGDTK